MISELGGLYTIPLKNKTDRFKNPFLKDGYIFQDLKIMFINLKLYNKL